MKDDTTRNGKSKMQKETVNQKKIQQEKVTSTTLPVADDSHSA